MVLASITTAIAMDNPKVYSLAIAVISHCVSHIHSMEVKIGIINKIRDKFRKLPNCGYLEIWMQRLSLKVGVEEKYNEKLCHIVQGEENVVLWNNEWLKEEMTRDFNLHGIFNRDKAEKLGLAISGSEVSPFCY